MKNHLPYRRGILQMPIDAYDLDGNLVHRFDHVTDIRELKADAKLNNIVAAADGKNFSAYGFRWAWPCRDLVPGKRFTANNRGYCKERLPMPGGAQ